MTHEELQEQRQIQAANLTDYILSPKVITQPNARELIFDQIERIMGIRDDYLEQRDAARNNEAKLTECVKQMHDAHPEVPYPEEAVKEVELGLGIGGHGYQFPISDLAVKQSFAERVKAANSNLIR